MGVCPERCCCTCEELLGIGTDFEIQVGDQVRIFTTGGIGPEPFMGELLAVEENTLVVQSPDTDFIRYCCAHITTIERITTT